MSDIMYVCIEICHKFKCMLLVHDIHHDDSFSTLVCPAALSCQFVTSVVYIGHVIMTHFYS